MVQLVRNYSMGRGGRVARPMDVLAFIVGALYPQWNSTYTFYAGTGKYNLI